jgi:hypothetical protein
MKKITDILTKEEIKFTKADLPMLIHGKEHSGASLLSITIASLLHKANNKLCIFTAYPMAKEEFLKQIINSDTVFYLEDEKDFEQALKFQTIIVQSGNAEVFLKLISYSSFERERILFIKNIETINIPIFEFISLLLFIVSGDLELNTFQRDFNNYPYNTKILFNPIAGEIIPSLEKYQAFIKNKSNERIITLS